MRVTGIGIENYRSLRHVDFDMRDFTVITGANGSGKSNFVDAINFIGEVYADGLEQAVARNGGLAGFAHDRGAGPSVPVTLTVRASLGRADVEALAVESPLGPWASDQVANFALTYVHSFTVALADGEVGAEFRLMADRIEFLDAEGRLVAGAGFAVGDTGVPGPLDHTVVPTRANGRMIREILDPLTREGYLGTAVGLVDTTSLLLEWRGLGRAVEYVRRAIAGVRVHQLSPQQCRTPSVATPHASLERHGGNLAAAAKHLERHDTAAWTLVENAMRSIVPALDHVKFSYTSDRRLELAFVEHDLARRPWSAAEVSDGTIQAFALFVALYDSRFPLLVVEEPENSVHPWILREFLGLCRQAGKQIVLTTHSPIVLNHVPPESVCLMVMVDGLSTVTPLLGHAARTRPLIDSGELTLFDVYDSGVIDASVPQGLARGTG